MKLTTASKQIKLCKLSSRGSPDIKKNCRPARCTCCHQQIYPNSVNSYGMAYNNNLAAFKSYGGYIVVCPHCYVTNDEFDIDDIITKQKWATMTIGSNLAETKVFLSNEFTT